MAGVTFSEDVGGDGSTVTDDGNASTGLAQDGHRTRFVPALAQVVAVASWVKTTAQTVLGYKNAAAESEATALTYKNDAANSVIAAGVKVTEASAQADRAEEGATNAEYFAGLAESTNPNAAIRVNPRTITESVGIANGYNGLSAGPIAIGDGVTITIGDNATWSIV
ncbi:hypothetical protein [Zhongshania marina]|uniref:Uncharacterized protein n=1 Tax=Zhongshania marina TaxID=2304603 RepID=A0A2S4HGF6_9GAMM|nr:hypothetical protein [Marortus luteolus]POP53057.1 hypothetical protein C0068_08170 [Marortus luteolus]